MARDRILIIDDEEHIRELMVLHLAAGGYKHVLEAGNGRDGIHLLKKDGNMESVGLIICDIRMPGVSGDMVVDFLHEQAPEIPVVIIAGYADADITASMRDKGVKDFLVKPVTKDRLLSVVKKNMAG